MKLKRNRLVLLGLAPIFRRARVEVDRGKLLTSFTQGELVSQHSASPIDAATISVSLTAFIVVYFVYKISICGTHSCSIPISERK